MTDARKFILFELNEVPLRVIRYYVERHPRSTFAKILDKGVATTTVAPDQGHLSPWITWPTVHRGVANDRHHLAVLGQDTSEADRKYPPVWQVLARTGRRVGVFGSLHSYPLPSNLDDYAFYVPDTFAAGPESHPSTLSVFQKFNLSMVDKSGRNVSRELPLRSGLRFVRRSPSLGVRAITFAKIARQLASERLKPHRAGRRRTMQSVLSFDLFLKQLVETEPDAAFYFTNHVASSLHRYWPAAFPQDYSSLTVSDEWIAKFSGEIDYAMGEADRMLDELVAFVEHRPDYVLLVASSMGQAAVDDPARQVSRQILLGDDRKLMAALGIQGRWERRRTMEPCYTFHFDDSADADSFSEALSRVWIANEKASFKRVDAHSVEITVGNADVRDEDFRVRTGNADRDPAEFGLVNMRIQDEIGSAAYHVPEGSLVYFDPRSADGGRELDEQPSTTRIAPTLLALSGIAPPDYMDPPIEFVPGKVERKAKERPPVKVDA